MPASGALVYDTTTSAFQPTGMLFNTNDYAMFLAIFLPIVFWRLTFVQGAWRFVWMLSVLSVVLYLVVMTYSRLGLIAVLLVVAALVIQYTRRLAWLIGAVLTFLMAIVLLVFPQALARIIEVIDASFTEKGASTTDRVERYQSLWEIVVNSRFRGVGAGNSPIQLNEYRLGHEVLQDAILAPHNFWLELLADGGFMGLIALGLFASFFGVAVCVWWTGRRSVDRLLRLVPVLVLLVFMFASVALSTVIDKRYLWLAVGMAVSVMNFSMRSDWRERGSG
ncbi:O-Antigen Polymerase family protein [Listeria grandensis FSL F6-0971]|uniref:O-Antigen polymerase family protein n=1 Tax=Listeria grandensis FSL F6-0971 TaxID=1265819 RepID=W7BS96_9LIST|nr:O-Antigen Polymerase family protein [Listeria grandensis FSL F6-0971]